MPAPIIDLVVDTLKNDPQLSNMFKQVINNYKFTNISPVPDSKLLKAGVYAPTTPNTLAAGRELSNSDPYERLTTICIKDAVSIGAKVMLNDIEHYIYENEATGNTELINKSIKALAKYVIYYYQFALLIDKLAASIPEIANFNLTFGNRSGEIATQGKRQCGYFSPSLNYAALFFVSINAPTAGDIRIMLWPDSDEDLLLSILEQIKNVLKNPNLKSNISLSFNDYCASTKVECIVANNEGYSIYTSRDAIVEAPQLKEGVLNKLKYVSRNPLVKTRFKL